MFFDIFLTVWKKHREHWKNQCRQWIRNRQSFYLGWCHRVLLDPDPSRCSDPRVKSPASCPRNVSSVGLGALEDYVLTRVPVSTQSQRTFPVSRASQGPCWRQVVADLLSLDQIEMKNRRRRSFNTEPTVIFFGGLLFPSYVCQTFSLSVPDSSHWVEPCAYWEGLTVPSRCPYVHIYACVEFFTFQKFKTFQLRRKKQTIFLTLSLKNKGKKVSLRIVSVACEVTGMKSREEFAPERRGWEISAHPERCRCCVSL